MKNKKITISGMTADEWLDSDSESIKKSDMIPPKYEKRIVAFIDLLAMKDLVLNIKPGDEREALEKIEKIKGIVEIETKPFEKKDDFFLLQISDSFIFTCSQDDTLTLIQLLAIIQMRILKECQFLLRGAITYGDVYVADEGKQIIGPAYIYAYLLQEKNAIYPRIILHNSLLQVFSERHLDSKDIMILSDDTEMYIDYLESFMALNDKKEKEKFITKLKREHVFDYLLANYKKYNEINNHSAKQKYGWTMQYFKSKGVWPNDK